MYGVLEKGITGISKIQATMIAQAFSSIDRTLGFR
jgi:hypothetical protein